MADDRRRRFSQIERPRAAGGAPPDASPGTDARFGALEEPAAPAPPPAAGPGAPSAPVARGHTNRFRPAAERDLEVEARGEDSQPFVRCFRCETDSSRYAARCSTCGEPLDSDAQRAFNERLWAERRAVAQAEADAAMAREVELERARQEASAARRTMGEVMAREVGEQERRRLEREGLAGPEVGPPGWGGGGRGWGGAGPGGFGDGAGPGGWGEDAPAPGRPIGFRLLEALPEGWRVPAGLAAAALVVGLFLVRPAAGLVAGAVLASLFLPRRSRWYRGW